MEGKQEQYRPGSLVLPATLGLFEKRLDGDDALMELARLRFQQSDLGAEMHAGTPEYLAKVMQFRPSAAAPVVVHLPRDFCLLQESSCYRIVEFAARFAGSIQGLVLHDHPEMRLRARDFRHAAQDLDSRLQAFNPCPTVFIEYAVGLEPGVFFEFVSSIRQLSRISACVDVGHVGIWQVRTAYAAIHPGEDVCALKNQPALLPARIADVQSAVATALPVVLELIRNIGGLGKPVHFHLHDGHPLSTFSPFGVSDHLSFFAEIPLGFEYLGRRCLPVMFGPPGLTQIVAAALESITGPCASFTLEIHPGDGQLALDDAAPLFNHWRDKTNAERMNQWLSVLVKNHELLRSAIQGKR